jgi:uncharacterized protein
MDKQTFQQIETHMLSCMNDAAHDAEHVYRVLYNALDIAATEHNIDYEVLIAACLLHDIGRARQFENPKLCHAAEGGTMAYVYLLGIDFPVEKVEQVKQCIISHRYRSDAPPVTIEAKILFDADKVDVTGALGVARTLFYQGHVGTALYGVDSDGNVLDGTFDDTPSFFREYNFKLKRIYDGCYTKRGNEIIQSRRQTMDAYYGKLLEEVMGNRKMGEQRLTEVLT